ncbi:MAG: ATP-dependent DNA helicase RecQ [Selenomonadaceae bacterium]|nr:ATP-dependent DNA helicase RecQ [Selenomonadaceae bacterium]
MKEIILRTLRGQIEKIPSGKNVFVLKGVPLSFVGDENFSEDLEAATNDPLNYFIKLTNGKRKFLTYEEFLLLNPFILAQYDLVYVLKNNLFMEQFPIESKFSDATKKVLLDYFTELENIIEEPEEKNLGTASKLIDIFNWLKGCGNFLIGAYNDEQILNEPKVKTLNLFDSTKELDEINFDNVPNFIDLQEEADFINFLREIIFATPEKIFVRTHYYAGDKEKLNERLKMLAAQIEIIRVLPEEFKRGFEHRNEFTEILARYWNHDSFRNFKVYDLQKLNVGKKIILDVSQEQIISDIVKQVENCMNGNDIQDIFVTAPTGAGKSVIFQIPAIYLAEKYNLMTIVISPLIGLMNDQVKNLELKNYRQAATINSDISPILKDQIVEKVAAGDCNILYISPETLLSRSDVEQLIGDRTIGLVVIDEAHIVTTWGKQFRADYWYLGDHIRKLRKVQSNRKGHSFIIATFTATAIYGGVEDMYDETITALHMREPITYLGYVKRGDIEIKIDKTPVNTGERAEFELEKFSDLENAVIRAKIFKRKTLIYFPEVQLIETAKYILQNRNNSDTVAIYHGKLNRDDKRENYEKFFRGDKLVMLATKAFGMGIDINDIEIVMHYAPTGNVCDYVQEIGRAARRNDLRGEALYHYDKKDFKYIKRLHGLSAIKKYQLIAVVKKIYELWSFKRKNNLLLDAENFTYIFDRYNDEANSINKVKTALLIIQKDFEARLGFSPLTVRPIPLFAVGFFVINPYMQKYLLQDYGECLKEIEPSLHICRVNLQMIWEKDFRDKSFPQFKYLIYSKKDDFPFNKKYPLQPALYVEITFEEDFRAIFKNLFGQFKAVVNKSSDEMKYLSVEDLVGAMKISEFKARNICEVLIASMISYRKNFYPKGHPLFAQDTSLSGQVYYRFNEAMKYYFAWVEKFFKEIFNDTKEGKLYISDATTKRAKEINTVLGILEALGVLNFKMTGGSNSQIYIHINQIKNLKKIIDARGRYQNKILELVKKRHEISVAMLTYIYENNFDNAAIWNLLEDYFLGKIPDEI